MPDTDNPFGVRDKPLHELERNALEGHGSFAERGASIAEITRRKQEHANAIADRQIEVAGSAATAAKRAAWAAWAAALAAVANLTWQILSAKL
jgi:hypothetical protein